MIFCFGGFGDNPDKIQWGYLKKAGIPHKDFYDEKKSFYQLHTDSILEEIYKYSDGVGNDRFLGVSMGGYGSLMFSALTQLGPALAFSPQTTILFPEQSHPSKAKAMRNYKDTAKYPDISALPKPPEGTYVLYGSLNVTDAFQAERLRNWCTVLKYPSKSHGWFKDDISKESFRDSVTTWLETTKYDLNGLEKDRHP
jgi:hypothetical protein